MLNCKYKFNDVMKLSDRIESINLLRIQNRANSLAISMEFSNNSSIRAHYSSTADSFVNSNNSSIITLLIIELNKNKSGYINEVSNILKNKEDLIKLLTPEEQEVELEETYISLDDEIETLVFSNSLILDRYLVKLLVCQLKFYNFMFTTYYISFNVTEKVFLPIVVFLKLNSLILINIHTDITVYDRPGKKYRFVAIYYFISLIFNLRYKIFVKLEELQSVHSLAKIYSSLMWSERECWDLFGVFFKKNFDLRRLLTDYGFVGFPLRKDFPLTGFYELIYDDSLGRISYVRVELIQELRSTISSYAWSKNPSNKKNFITGVNNLL